MSSKFSSAVAVSPQGRKLTTTLAVAVNGLSNLESILPAARALAKRHVNHGVKSARMIAVLSIPTDRDREEQNAQLLDASQALR